MVTREAPAPTAAAGRRAAGDRNVEGSGMSHRSPLAGLDLARRLSRGPGPSGPGRRVRVVIPVTLALDTQC